MIPDRTGAVQGFFAGLSNVFFFDRYQIEWRIFEPVLSLQNKEALEKVGLRL